jgi:hypothetical protein
VQTHDREDTVEIATVDIVCRVYWTTEHGRVSSVCPAHMHGRIKWQWALTHRVVGP